MDSKGRSSSNMYGRQIGLHVESTDDTLSDIENISLYDNLSIYGGDADKLLSRCSSLFHDRDTGRASSIHP